jgi:hypothetical protein
MGYSLVVLFLIYLLPYLGAFLECQFKIEIKISVLIISLGIPFLWFLGVEMEYKKLEFLLLYISFILLAIFVFKRIKKDIFYG